MDDENLAKTLVRAGILTPGQYAECGQDPGRTVINAAVQRGYLDAAQVEVARARAEAELFKTWALRRDAAVAKFVLRRNLVERDDIEAARNVQLAHIREGRDVTLLEALIEARYLSKKQGELVAASVDETGKRRLGDFLILGKLGEGGMGAVYKARQVSHQRTVALKVLPTYLAREPGVLKRFRREAEAALRLDHPNIVRGLAVGEADGRQFFAMEFVDGRSLKRTIEEDGPLTLTAALPLFIDITKGLAYVHNLGLVHRDIKPENVLITREGIPKLADLGLAKEIHLPRSAVTQTGMALGTAYYMPPEQAKDAKRADRRSDVYALGATFYHALTGRVPYPGGSAFDVLRKHETARLDPPNEVNPQITGPLSAVIVKMMQKQPEKRHQSADEVLADLRRLGPAAGGVGALPEHAQAPSVDGPGDTTCWYAWLVGPGGAETVRQFELAELRRMIVDGTLPLDAPVRRGADGPFKWPGEHPQLAEAVRARRGEDPPVQTARRRWPWARRS